MALEYERVFWRLKNQVQPVCVYPDTLFTVLVAGEEFPEDPKAQLWGAIGAVFNSWMNQRAKTYRPWS